MKRSPAKNNGYVAQTEIGKFGRDRGARKILPEAYGEYSEDKIFRATKISGELAISGWTLLNMMLVLFH